MSIRTVLTLSIAGLLSVAVIAAAGLTAFTIHQHHELDTWRAATGGVQVGEEIELGVLRLSRVRLHTESSAAAGDESAELDRQIRGQLETAAGQASGAAERQVVGKAAQQVGRYLDRHAPDTDEDRLTAALSALGELIAFNAAEADAATRDLGRSSRVADVMAASAGGLLFVGTAAIFLWLRRAAFAPLFELRGVIDRFAGGDPAVRASAGGPAEIASIARAFNGMADQLAAYRQRQMAFLAAVAHDLRAPLAPLKAAAAMGRRAEILGNPQQTQRLFEVADRQVDYLERMTADLLDAARVEGGHLQLRREICDLREIASAVAALFSAQADAQRLHLAVPDAPVLVRCDELRIQQVLTNLVGNALKYSPGPGAVAISVGRDEAGASVAVADRGIGIARDDLERIFEPFQRGRALQDDVPGVGLGLATSRRLVQMHGGSLEVTSQPGIGSTFVVRLPSEPAPLVSTRAPLVH